jgi:hypothetical protein
MTWLAIGGAFVLGLAAGALIVILWIDDISMKWF